MPEARRKNMGVPEAVFEKIRFQKRRQKKMTLWTLDFDRAGEKRQKSMGDVHLEF